MCMCSICNGRECDHRTIDRYMKEMYMQQAVHNSKIVHDPPVETDMSPDVKGLNSDSILETFGEDSLEESVIANHYILPEERIQQFVLNEVRLKLTHGHSITTAEDHLANASKLLGGQQMPTKWSAVLQLLK